MSKVVVAIVAVVVAAAVTVAVMRRQQAEPPADAPVVSVQELMEGVVNPGAQAIFNSVGVITTTSGTEERQPRSDEEWAAVERQAAILAEAASLLKNAARPIAPPGEPDATAEGGELPTAEIASRRQNDLAGWSSHADAVRVVAVKARDAARGRSVEGLFSAGADLEGACEACHQTFWYNAPPGVRIRR